MRSRRCRRRYCAPELCAQESSSHPKTKRARAHENKTRASARKQKRPPGRRRPLRTERCFRSRLRKPLSSGRLSRGSSQALARGVPKVLSVKPEGRQDGWARTRVGAPSEPGERATDSTRPRERPTTVSASAPSSMLSACPPFWPWRTDCALVEPGSARRVVAA